jgi:hypothetical protein
MKNCIDTKNYDGTRTIFIEKQRQQKSLKHPELREESFIKRIKIAIEKPDFVYEDLAKKGYLVYYKYEYALNDRTKYTKVVLCKRRFGYFVVTSYRPDYVKEKGKTKIIYGKDNN